MANQIFPKVCLVYLFHNSPLEQSFWMTLHIFLHLLTLLLKYSSRHLSPWVYQILLANSTGSILQEQRSQNVEICTIPFESSTGKRLLQRREMEKIPPTFGKNLRSHFYPLRISPIYWPTLEKFLEMSRK